MPAAPIRCLCVRWNVRGDDFVLPAAQAIVVSLLSISLLLSCLVALFGVDFSCTVHSLLYAPLLATVCVQIAFVLCEGLVLVISAQGSIWKNVHPRRHITKLIFVRAVIAVLELLTLIVATVGTWLPSSVGELKACPKTLVALHVTRGVVFFLWLVYLCFLLKILFYIDPLGCFSPGLLEHISILESDDPSAATVSTDGNANVLVAKQISYWTDGTRRLIRQVSGTTAADVLKSSPENTIGQAKMRRRLGALFCCLCVRDQRSMSGALEEVAKGFYTIFGDSGNNVVLTDIIAGMKLVHHEQHRRKDLGHKFRKATFRMMPATQRFGLDPETIRKDSHFDWSNEDNLLLFENLVHYMHYAMGTYGWSLHVFDNVFCGLCQLSAITCCRCNYHCRSKRRSSFVKEGCCMCGVGALRLQTGIEEEDILYLHQENMIYSLPFCVCHDHGMKSVVLCIRGTLSFKDSLTDMSYSPVHIEVAGVRDTYVHGGMLKTALGIMETLSSEQLLERAFEGHEGYQLVITGHSLGAGVASVLALHIKLNFSMKFPNLKCYAFSPPGSLFSFPLAQYCKEFITSVVLGNDIVPRITLRSLLYLKFSVIDQLDNCDLPKYKVLFSKKALRKAYNLKVKEPDEDDSQPQCLEDQVCNNSTTQNWLRERIFNKGHRQKGLSNAERLHLQKSLSIYPRAGDVAETGLFDAAISLQPRASVLSASLFEAGHSSPQPISIELATPGTSLHKAAPQILQYCQAHDGNTFLPLFPPGRLLHIKTSKYGATCCGRQGSLDEAEECDHVCVSEVHNENMGVILVDKGMVEDHLPNHVLAALVQCRERLLLTSPQYDPSKMREMRERNEDFYRKVYRACAQNNRPEEKGFTFLLSETPMVAEPRQLAMTGGGPSLQREACSSLGGRQSLSVAAEVHCEHVSEDPPIVHDANHLTLPKVHMPQTLEASKRPYKLNLSPLVMSNYTVHEQKRHSESLV